MISIDLHCHMNSGSAYDTKVHNLYYADFERLIEERNRFSIVATAMTTFSAVLSSREIISENQYMWNYAEHYDNVYQWVVVDPRDEESFHQANEMLKSNKVLGIKIHPPYHGYDYMEYADKLCSFADTHNTAMLMHPHNNERISEVVAIADNYPHMKLIVAHLGFDEHIKAIDKAKNGNVYTDTSGSLSYQNNVIEEAVRRVGSEKIFFGTDTYACAFQYGRIHFANIPDRDKENILYRNALREFKQFQKMGLSGE